jgi:hypothetical protein
VGSELLPALLLGALALVVSVCAPPARSRAGESRWRRLAIAGAVAVAVWLLAGTIGSSEMARLHSRYLEAFSPAIAAALGVGVATLAKASIEQRWRLALFPIFALCVLYAIHLAAHEPGLRTFILCGATVAALCLLISVVEPPVRIDHVSRRRGTALVTALLLLPLLAVPAAESLAIVRHHSSDSTTRLAHSPRRLARLRHYLVTHQGRARYEVATRNPWQAAPLIARDARPVLIVRNVNGHALVSLKKLRGRIRAGQLRYVWLGHRCSERRARHFKACQPLASWVRKHGVRVTAAGRGAGLWRVKVR